MSSKFVSGFVVALFLSAMLYVDILHFTPRAHFYALMAQVSALFGLYIALYLYVRRYSHLYHYALVAAILFRMLLIPTLPNLSDDFYRFVWDGRTLSQGISPYTYTPNELRSAILFLPNDSDARRSNQSIIQSISNDIPFSPIRDQRGLCLNSPDYYSVYPPVCQFVGWIACRLSPDNLYGSVVLMKIFILFFELLSIGLLHGLLPLLDMPQHRSLLYALNPLVIIELCGNLHFEAAMICFILAAVCLLLKATRQFSGSGSLGKLALSDKNIWTTISLPILGLSAVSFSLAVCSKLLPLMFLPFLWRRLGGQLTLFYYAVVGVATIILFVPFFDLQTVQAIYTSAKLYFERFEFNASIYYLLRNGSCYIGNCLAVGTVGQWLAVAVLTIVIGLAIGEKEVRVSNWIRTMSWSWCCYFLLASTVHPWYITPLVAFSVLNGSHVLRATTLIWSASVFLSYFAYSHFPYREHTLLLCLEYGLFFSSFIIFKLHVYK